MTAATHLTALIQSLQSLEAMNLVADSHDVLATTFILTEDGVDYAIRKLSDYYESAAAETLANLLYTIVDLGSACLVSGPNGSIVPNASLALRKAGFDTVSVKTSDTLGNIAVYIKTRHGNIFVAMQSEPVSLLANADHWGYDEPWETESREADVTPEAPTSGGFFGWFKRLF